MEKFSISYIKDSSINYKHLINLKTMTCLTLMIPRLIPTKMYTTFVSSLQQKKVLIGIEYNALLLLLLTKFIQNNTFR